jgi:hypothetical protein
MKYFTPELIARGQTEDDRILHEVEALWDERCDQYNAYIASIKGELPAGLRRIEDGYYLHDATVQGMGRRNGAFVIVLQLDPPPHSLLTFTYDLTEEPHIDPQALPEGAGSTGPVVEWLYDELEKVPGHPPTWRQSILLSNGWEVTLHFRDVRVEEVEALLPAPRNGAPLPRNGTIIPERQW